PKMMKPRHVSKVKKPDENTPRTNTVSSNASVNNNNSNNTGSLDNPGPFANHTISSSGRRTSTTKPYTPLRSSLPAHDASNSDQYNMLLSHIKELEALRLQESNE